MSEVEKLGLITKEFLDQIIQNDLAVFSELTKWTPEDIDAYSKLLDNLKKPYDRTKETPTEKGNRLEDLVNFIIKKTYFFDVTPNVHTGTNEADQIIYLSEKGKQALHKFQLNRELLVIKEDMIIGECKNYDTNLKVTYVGKFYSLLVACDVNFGIIFTVKGLTGAENEYREAYGLTKVLRLIEKYKNDREFYIINFKLEDYELMKDGNAKFLDIVSDKMKALQTASNYSEYLKDNSHEKEEEIKSKINEFRKNEITKISL